MSGSASLDLERSLLQHSLAIAPMPVLGRVYVALCLTAPTETAGGTEASGGGYSRMPATFALMASPSNAASNVASVEFLPAAGNWGTIGYFELWTAATGGTRLYWGPLTDPADGVPIEMDVTTGDTVRFSAGALIVQAADTVMTGSGVSSFNARTGEVTLAGADVTGAGGALLTALRYPNYADNSGFSVNQRGYVSGAALTAGAYGHDRWKAGAGGCTYTFTQSGGPSTIITITAGTLQQVVEAASVAGGSYVLSWAGTAQGRVGAGSYAASPVAVAGIVAGANTTIEFNAGTLGQVKLDTGTVATPWQAAPTQQEIARCQRFYEAGAVIVTGVVTAASQVLAVCQVFQVAKRIVPTIAINWAAQSNSVGSFATNDNSSFKPFATSVAAGQVSAQGTYTASADL
jgi:hypothetical protein